MTKPQLELEVCRIINIHFGGGRYGKLQYNPERTLHDNTIDHDRLGAALSARFKIEDGSFRIHCDCKLEEIVKRLQEKITTDYQI